MSMTMLTIFQVTGIAAGYLGVTLFLPWLLLRRRLAGLKTPLRIQAYYVCGNFYIIYMVYLLQLLHISCRPLLVLGTFAPFGVLFFFRYRKAGGQRLEKWMGWLTLVAEGKKGRKTLLLKAGRMMGRFSARQFREWLHPHLLEVLLAFLVLVAVLYMYGTNMVNVYGYCATDVVLHNHWINEMGRNNIFVDGVYPFGFHCLIYYLHEVFAIPVFVLLRVFYLVQTLLIHMMLLLFLRAVCKSRYTPYIGVFAYVFSDVFYQYAYYRYFASLPQELGMVFILPAAGYVIAFFQEGNFYAVGVKDKRGQRMQSVPGQCLALLSISFALAFTVHFYDAIVAGLFCVGIAAGFCFRCFRWRYFRRILVSGGMALLLALLPLVVAYAGGTPLQNSLNWGMSLISQESAGDTGDKAEEKEQEGEKQGQEGEKQGQEEAASRTEGMWESLQGKMDMIVERMDFYTANFGQEGAWFLLGSMGVLFLSGILWFLLRRPGYGGVLVSVSVFLMGLALLQASEKLGLPGLIENTRYAIYLAYGIGAAWSLIVDSVLFLLFQEKRLIHLGGLVTLGVSWVALGVTGVRQPQCYAPYETNGAITCLTNILRENKDGSTWTICSANDEHQMIREYGYHYETIQFLRGIQKLEENTMLTIPTSTVYFFVEKVPLLYSDYISTKKADREVSREGAGEPLSRKDGIKPYIGYDRWVTMSHMYYWAQAFRELYPNEMEVYYETDDFVCYRLCQDGYSLYNFAIDYGYN